MLSFYRAYAVLVLRKIQSLRRILLLLVCLITLPACNTLAGEDEFILMQSDIEAYGTEAVAIRESIQNDQVQVAATVDALATESANFTEFNRVLVSTVRAVLPPTQAVNIVNNEGGPLPLEMFDLSDGVMRFVQIGAAGTVNVDDRCFVSHQTFFTTSADVIYLVALALNLKAGTNLRVDWSYGGELVHQSNWTAPENKAGECIALELRPGNALFLTGNWTATLYINGAPQDPASFTITER